MGNINLYKIDIEKTKSFQKELQDKMNRKKTFPLVSPNEDGAKETFKLTLYLDNQKIEKPPYWKWVLEEFKEPPLEISTPPKCVILIEKDNGSTYAVTFGHSYFLVDKFCDRDFGFMFARKLSYVEIKTTTLTTPNSRRNKTVNTYINYNQLEFDSGESFAKLKAKIKLPENFALYKPAIEIGSSIRFTTEEESLQHILKLIQHVERTLDKKTDLCHIPVFSKIKDENRKQLLEANLRKTISDNPMQVNISELDIIGATEIFNHNDSEFKLRYKGKQKLVSTLSMEEIKSFCRENGWNYTQILLDIEVISFYDGKSVVTKKVRDLIDYTDDNEKCLLSKGTWYQYNDDYLSYLKDSIAEISVKYIPTFNFSEEEYKDFIQKKYEEEKDENPYKEKTEEQIKNSLQKKYYAERAYNLLREQKDGFKNYDRNEVSVDGHKIEIMDLYKDEMMCAVKIGSSSSKLCYAVDQSLTALKLYKKKNFPDIPKISTVVLWFVLDKHKHIEDESGYPRLERLDMLMLKNRIDQWKKEVRLQGFTPMIYINYRTK